MICVAISDKSKANCLDILKSVEMAEIRLDLTGSSTSDIEEIFASGIPLIATCRFENTSLETQKTKLIKAIQSGADFVDIEIEAPKEQKTAIIEEARKHNCKVIISYHNFEKTPGLKELYQIADECYNDGADLAKIATMVNQPEDNARLMSLYSIGRPVVSLGMGELGKVTRLVSTLLGAEFSFASQDDGAATAPGQISYSTMKEVIDLINKVIY